MTRDAKDSLTALAVVSSFAGFFCLALLLIPNDLEIPRWVTQIGFGVSAACLIVGTALRRRQPMGKPE